MNRGPRKKYWAGNLKPGMHNTSTYKIWSTIKARCNNANHPKYNLYGGRGIKVCDRWNSAEGFPNFLEDMGIRPEGMEIDRTNNDGNYSPDNCRWVTHKENMNNVRKNVRYEFNGERKTVSEWSAIYGLSYRVIRARLYKLKWPIEKALTEPVKSIKTEKQK